MADGYEFSFNERLVDFKGDTESWLGMQEKETGPQLMWMSNEDMAHLIIPISSEVAVIFCNESRCWHIKMLSRLMYQAGKEGGKPGSAQWHGT